MKAIRFALFTLLFCIFPARVLIQWVPLLGFPLIATAFILVEYLCLFYLLINMLAGNTLPYKTKSYKVLYALYWIYSFYLIYYIIINPLIPRDLMAHIPESDFDIVRSMIIMGLIIPVVVNFQRYLDIYKFVKVSVLCMSVVLLAYTLTNDMSLYLYAKTLTGRELSEFKYADYGMISSLTMGEFCSMALIFGFLVRDKWTNNKFVSYSIFTVITLFLLSLLIIFSQRGPVLFLALTILFYYFCKGKIGKTLIFVLLFVIILVYLLGDAIVQLMSKYDLSLIERFMNISEDGGSGRFGDSDAEYNLAFRQIMDGPFFGSYFRNTTVRLGDYPHNFILELLMTFGFVFTIPFLYLCWKGIKRSYFAIKHDIPMEAFCLIFINVYACHLTSFSIAASNNMWLLLAMVIGCKNFGETIYGAKILTSQK